MFVIEFAVAVVLNWSVFSNVMPTPFTNMRGKNIPNTVQYNAVQYNTTTNYDLSDKYAGVSTPLWLC